MRCYTVQMTQRKRRNDKLVDKWSFVHIACSGALAWLFGPLAAFVIVTLWEPFEVLVLSPLLAKVHVHFGYEAWRNSLSDIAFNTLGILLVMLATR